MRPRRARTVGEIDGFITLLRAGCADPAVNATLSRLLILPDLRRRALVHAWVSDLIVAQAPRNFIEAIGCLLDDGVAEKAYEVLFECERVARGKPAHRQRVIR